MQALHKTQVFIAGGGPVGSRWVLPRLSSFTVAAHIHSPVGGRGMNLGIEDACWLAWLIEQGRSAVYSAYRHPVGAKVLKLTAQPTRLISSNSLSAKALRRWIIPYILGMEWVQGRILPSMLALDTPKPPWL